MEPKKSHRKQVERHYQNFVLVGIAIGLFITLSAFKWQAVQQYKPLKNPRSFVEPVMVLSTSTAKPKQEQKREKKTEPAASPKRKVLSATGKVVKKFSKSPIEPLEPIAFDSSLVNQMDEFPDAHEEPNEPPLPSWRLTKMPSFPGGAAERISFFRRHFKYPSLELQAGIGGTVVIKLLINKDGDVEQIEITSAPTQAMGKEALRVARKMPSWEPGEWNQQQVSTWVQFPLKLIAR